MKWSLDFILGARSSQWSKRFQRGYNEEWIRGQQQILFTALAYVRIKLGAYPLLHNYVSPTYALNKYQINRPFFLLEINF